jgi:phosphoribosylformylglycinamidine synthase subunit PurQ / glutaminase
MTLGVVVFPGSNCERDMADAVRFFLKRDVRFLWHDDTDLHGVEAVLLPGGFSYGDYLRSGALARFSPIMTQVQAFAEQGGPVLGVCNGFQVLTEAGLLPGALMRNASLRFQCQQVTVQVENNTTCFSRAYTVGETIHLPIAHADGNYYAEPAVIERLEANNQVVLRYTQDINGSINRIAGICNEAGNVVGMMPHPERNLWPDIANDGNWNGDGGKVFESLRQTLGTLAHV